MVVYQRESRSIINNASNSIDSKTRETKISFFLFPRLFSSRLFPFLSLSLSLFLSRFPAQSSGTCKLARRRRVGRETKRGSCITRSNLTQVEATRLGVYAKDRSKHLHFPCACFSFYGRPTKPSSLSLFLSRARFRFTFLVIMHYYPRAAFTAIQRSTRRRRVVLFPANG